jgi:hypothetical protein
VLKLQPRELEARDGPILAAIDKLSFEHGFLAIRQEQRLQAVKRPW